MSYVIQNFYQPSSLIILNDRIRLLFRSINIFKFFTFFKLAAFYIKVPITTYFAHDYFLRIYTWIFDQNPIFFFVHFDITSRLHLTSKFHRTLRIYTLEVMNALLDDKKPKVWALTHQKSFFENSYFIPVPTVFFYTHKKIYKSLFLFFMILTPFQWPVVTSSYKFSDIFFYPSWFFKMIYFENIKTFKTHQL